MEWWWAWAHSKATFTCWMVNHRSFWPYFHGLIKMLPWAPFCIKSSTVFALHHACISKKWGGVPQITSIDNGTIRIAGFQNSIDICQSILHTSSLTQCIFILKGASHLKSNTYILFVPELRTHHATSLAFLSWVHPTSSISLYTSDTYSS